MVIGTREVASRGRLATWGDVAEGEMRALGGSAGAD